MATIILFCLGIAYGVVGLVVFIFALANGAAVDALSGLLFGGLLFWPATLIVAVFVFLILKSKHELRR